MITPSCLIKVVDNDPKGERFGTTFLVDFKLNSITTNLVYTILDEINHTENYQEYLKLYSIFLQEQKDFESFQKKQLDNLLKEKIQERLSTNFLIPDQIQFIKDNLTNFDSLIIEYKAGKEKALNSIVGRYLKLFKETKTNVDPLVLKNTLIDIL